MRDAGSVGGLQQVPVLGLMLAGREKWKRFATEAMVNWRRGTATPAYFFNLMGLRVVDLDIVRRVPYLPVGLDAISPNHQTADGPCDRIS